MFEQIFHFLNSIIFKALCKPPHTNTPWACLLALIPRTEQNRTASDPYTPIWVLPILASIQIFMKDKYRPRDPPCWMADKKAKWCLQTGEWSHAMGCGVKDIGCSGKQRKETRWDEMREGRAAGKREVRGLALGKTHWAHTFSSLSLAAWVKTGPKHQILSCGEKMRGRKRELKRTDNTVSQDQTTTTTTTKAIFKRNRDGV